MCKIPDCIGRAPAVLVKISPAPLTAVLPTCSVTVLSHLGGGLIVSSLPRHQRLEAYLLKSIVK